MTSQFDVPAACVAGEKNVRSYLQEFLKNRYGFPKPF